MLHSFQSVDLYDIDWRDAALNRFWKGLRPKLREAWAKMGEPARLSPSQEALTERIRSAFAGLRVGDDTLLYLSAEATDFYYIGDKQLERLCKLEVRDDWQQITPDLLAAGNAGFAFMDAEGFRYLLPAFMVNTLLYPQLHLSDESLSFYITDEKIAKEKLALLNDAQRACVSDFVNEMRLAEMRRDSDLIYWDALLPWENDQRVATAPRTYCKSFAEDMLLRYCEKHRLSLDLKTPEN